MLARRLPGILPPDVARSEREPDPVGRLPAGLGVHPPVPAPQVVAPDGSTRTRRNVAAFDATTGALIEGFQADTNGVVRALATDGNTLWLGGSFTAVRGSTRNRLAAVAAATGALRPFNPNANNIVYAMDLRAGRLFAAGVFSWIGGMARNRAERLRGFCLISSSPGAIRRRPMMRGFVSAT